MDVVALLVLITLAISGLVSPIDALSGFSNPAVITIWSMFIISAGLTRANVANMVGNQVLRFAGEGELRLVIIIMLCSGLMSAFMNNIGVAALMLPICVSISRRTGISPSKILMPMAFGTLLGGFTTILTTTNLLVSDALRKAELAPFEMFDFTPVGGVVLISGIIFITLAGRFILPNRNPVKAMDSDSGKLKDQYSLQARSIVMRIPSKSALEGKTLGQARLGAALSLVVFSIVRKGKNILAPDPSTVLQAEDKLLVGGKINRLNELRRWKEFTIEDEQLFYDKLVSHEIHLAEIEISSQSGLLHKELFKTNFRNRFGVNVLAAKKDSDIVSSDFSRYVIEAGDKLLIQGKPEDITSLPTHKDFNNLKAVSKSELPHVYQLQGKIFCLKVPPNSIFKGSSLKKSRLGDALGLRVLVIVRGSETIPMPDPQERLLAGDKLLIESKVENMEVFRGLQQMEIEEEIKPDLEVLESEKIGLTEAVLAPRSHLAGKTLKEINFRVKYGVQTIAIWREGRAHRSRLGNMPLNFGDALLLMGPKDSLQVLSKDRDFILLNEVDEDFPNKDKAPVAIFILAGILLPVILGWLPISIAAVAGATLMVLTRCLSMEDAYQSIDWRSVFLIAGMLPLGIAMQETGAANFLAEKTVAFSGGFGPWGVIIVLYLIIALSTTIIPSAVLVVLMAPIVLKTAVDMGLSPHSLMMTLAIAASASFTSPISHPANVLVMGPGGYRFTDYIKLGIPLAIVVMVVGLIMLSIVWPVT